MWPKFKCVSKSEKKYKTIDFQDRLENDFQQYPGVWEDNDIKKDKKETFNLF